jgi:hypothetical protein
MSRSGYSDDGENYELWRSAVESALCGKRGQAFLREMLVALDALPERRLISGKLVCDGECCALGAVALRRGTDVGGVDTEDRDALSETFGIAGAMAAEIMYMNDEAFGIASPRERYVRMREWVLRNIAVKPEELVGAEETAT